MKKLLFLILRLLARLILCRYRPDVIGITGSVGKTSAKLAIKAVLADDFNVRASPKSYNSEIGVPLTIIGQNNPGRHFFGWLKIIFVALKIIIFKEKNYPRILILEMAADHPGDIGYLVKFTKPKIGVITSVGPTHLEFFGTVDAVGREKGTLITNLAKDSFAVVNSDQQALKDLISKTKAQVITFGLGKADVLAAEINYQKETGGLDFLLTYRDEAATVSLPNLLGQPAIYSLLAAATVGLCYNLKLKDISVRLKNYQAPPGRLNLLPGIKYAKIIDDTYNSSPLAVEAALTVLAGLKCAGQKFAVLGDMLELGAYTAEAHSLLGKSVVRRQINHLITVGERARLIAKAAKESGMNPDHIYSFDSAPEAGKFLQDKINEGDLILLKASRAVHLELAVKEIMAEPERAGELLVRADN